MLDFSTDSNVTAKVIPYTNGRYSFTAVGDIIDNLTLEFVPKEERDDGPYVRLDNDVYSQPVKVAVLSAATFKKLNLPESKVKHVDVWFCNGDCGDITPTNLLWKYPETGIEPTGWSGYRYVPGYSNYIVNEDGVVRSVRDGEIMSNVLNSVGYPCGRYRRDDGASKFTLQHHLVALAWCKYGPDLPTMEANHIDTNPANPKASNLEWITKLENLAHARENGAAAFMRYGNVEHAPGAAQGVSIKNFRTGEITNHDSIGAAAKHYGSTPGRVHQAIYRGTTLPIYLNDYIVVKKGEEFPDTPTHFFTERAGGGPAAVLAKTVATGEIREYHSGSEFCRESGLSRKIVFKVLKDKSQREVEGLIFKYVADNSDWVK